MTDSIDLSGFDALVEAQESGLDVKIKGPDGKPLGLTIKVAGPDSSRYRMAVQSEQDELLQDEDATLPDAAEGDQRALRVLAKCTLAWSPNPKFGGKEYTCSEESAKELYTRYPFIREQVAGRAGRRASFIKRSAKSSAEPSKGAVKANDQASQQ